jgi:hypothetical protein
VNSVEIEFSSAEIVDICRPDAATIHPRRPVGTKTLIIFGKTRSGA